MVERVDPQQEASEFAERATEIAHELNNLLSVVRVNAQLARLGGTENAADDRLAEIEHAAEEAADLVTQLASSAARFTAYGDVQR